MRLSRSVLTSLLLGSLISFAAASWVYELEQENRSAHFQADAQTRIASLQLEINDRLSILDYIRFVVEESGPESADVVRRIFERFHHRSQILQGIAWARIHHSDNQLSLPVTLVEPLQRYGDWLGNDLSHIPHVMNAVQPLLAGDEQSRLLSIRSPKGEPRILTLTRTHTPSDNSLGLLIAAIDMPALLQGAVAQINHADIEVVLSLESANLGQLEYRWPEQSQIDPRLTTTAEITNLLGLTLQVRLSALDLADSDQPFKTAFLSGLFGIALTLLAAFYFNSQVRLRRELERLSTTDALTGIANRRLFDSALEREWHAARRSQEPISLLVLDIDHFKHYNDNYGHDAGDRCLREVASILRRVVARPRDLLARFGGEEFAILLPATDEGAFELAERCRQAVESANLPHSGSPYGCITLSIGCVTQRAKSSQSAEKLFKAADEALYRAKEAGRNRCAGE